ncbi:MAG: cobyrinate a,c-diamide synthase [Hydrogenophilaceae bacterium]|nr:cobyrinate a,c-diamide synthase [Hydrogenophilaceae bacterium]
MLQSRFLISAAHKSSGKTTLSIGLCAALKRRGLKVQPYKKGPDYIDPMWLTRASGRPCRNLDFYLMGHEEVTDVFEKQAVDADVALVEGNKGLYDGLDLDGSNSNAALSKLLSIPVVLVIDARGMTRGVAPLILGYQAFDRDIRIAGVILNQLGGSRHEGKLRAVIEHYTDVPVIGAVQHEAGMQILERHLGLIPSNEAAEVDSQIDRIAERVSQQVDLDRLLALTQHEYQSKPLNVVPRPPATCRIGIARDAAFGFYYSDDLLALEEGGAELVPINTLRDRHLPHIDGLIIGGGFPESFMSELEANVSLRQDIRRAIDAGLPAYAECGGLMYLSRTLRWKDETKEMVGVIPGNVVMHDRPVGRGYVRLKETGASPWDSDAPAAEIHAHEFHYSSIENLPDGLIYTYDVLRGHGIDGKRDGLVYRNLLASYTHLRSTRRFSWVKRFLALVEKHKNTASSQAAA